MRNCSGCKHIKAVYTDEDVWHYIPCPAGCGTVWYGCGGNLESKWMAKHRRRMPKIYTHKRTPLKSQLGISPTEDASKPLR